MSDGMEGWTLLSDEVRFKNAPHGGVRFGEGGGNVSFLFEEDPYVGMLASGLGAGLGWAGSAIPGAG